MPTEMEHTVSQLRGGMIAIRDFGWMTGSDIVAHHFPAPGKENRHCQCLATAVMHDAGALAYIRRALGLPKLDSRRYGPTWAKDIYEANDARTGYEGKAWAEGVLQRAIDLAESDMLVST